MRAKRGAIEALHPLPLDPRTELLEGRVTTVGTTVLATISPDEAIEVRCPAHVDRAWLAAAVKVAPVEAAFAVARNGTRPILVAIFPGPEHVAVRADLTLVARRVRIDAEEFRVQGKNAHLSLDRKGAVEVRGKDVTTRATRLNRVQGGAVRLN
jgi:hypothetical protein